jgi:hypothetical protein
VSAGLHHCAAITALGTLLMWGSNFEFQLGVNTGVTIKSKDKDGKLVDDKQKQTAMSGANASRMKKMKQFYTEPAEKGTPKRMDGAVKHDKVELITRPVVVLFPIGDGEKQVYAKQVSCGSTHTLLLDQHGDAWSWGSGRDGILGHHRSQPVVPMPRKITSLKVGLTARGL